MKHGFYMGYDASTLTEAELLRLRAEAGAPRRGAPDHETKEASEL